MVLVFVVFICDHRHFGEFIVSNLFGGSERAGAYGGMISRQRSRNSNPVLYSGGAAGYKQLSFFRELQNCFWLVVGIVKKVGL
jgi:hypothetical protein